MANASTRHENRGQKVSANSTVQPESREVQVREGGNELTHTERLTAARST
jgi:hypothetical protein